jgi:hypothetical protein
MLVASVPSLLTFRTRLMVILLCGLVTMASATSSTCSACDGAVMAALHVHHAADKAPPPLPLDGCDGACSCCGFHWLPIAQSDAAGLVMGRPIAYAAPSKNLLLSAAPRPQPPRV